MDSGLALPSSYSTTSEIPPDIYRPLLMIARLGYDANDIRHYYLTMLRQMRRTGTDNTEAAYTIGTPFNRKIPSSFDDDSSSARPTTESSEDHVSPRTVPTNWSWSRSASYEPSICEQSDLMANSTPQDLFNISPEHLQQQQLQMSQITPTQQMFDREHGVTETLENALARSANYDPSQNTHPQLDVNDFNANRSQSLAFPAMAGQWFGAEAFQPQRQVQQQPQYIHPWPSMNAGQPAQTPYPIAMSTTQVSLLDPYAQTAPSPPQRSFTGNFADDYAHPFAPAPAGSRSQLATELYHPSFLQIDVVPSRKRRKVLKTGVKRIAQSLGNAREPSI